MICNIYTDLLETEFTLNLLLYYTFNDHKQIKVFHNLVLYLNHQLQHHTT